MDEDHPDLPEAQQVAQDIEQVVQDEVQRAVQQALEANNEQQRERSRRQERETAPLATVLANTNNTDDDEATNSDETDYDVIDQQTTICGLSKRVFCALVMVMVAIISGVFAVAFSGQENSTAVPVTIAPSMAPTDQVQRLTNLLYPKKAEEEELLPEQLAAIQWIVEEDAYMPDDTAILSQELLERHALVTLYFGLNGPKYWNNNSANKWLTSISHCDWEYIECHPNSRSVSSLNLIGEELQLEGRIPPDIDKLTSLTELILTKTKIHGSLPLELYTKLTLLTSLNLARCRFLTGTIPPEIGNLSRLRVLDFQRNAMNGTLPVEIGLLGAELKEVYLNHNRFSGQIPTSIGQWTKIERFLFQENRYLSGRIPTEIGYLLSAQTLSLRGNNLTFTIPTEIGQLTSLEEIDLGNNTLFGPIPSEFGSLVKLTFLNLFDNNLTGFIPTELGKASELEYLYLNYNRLQGLPSELGNLTSLKELLLHQLLLESTIPSEIGRLTSLISLYLTNSRLFGSIPTEFGRLSSLQALYLSENGLSGPIPNEVLDMRQLQQVFLDQNKLTSTIPEDLCRRLNNLLTFQVGGNLLTGSLPPCVQ